MSKRPRVTRCAMTGVEIPLDDSFTLDVSAAYERVRSLRAEIAAVERVVQLLGPQPLKLPNGREVRSRLSVTINVAAGLDAGSTRALFVPWPEYIRRQSIANINRVLNHPVHGAALRALTEEERVDVYVLGRRLRGRLDAKGVAVSLDLRLAIEWGASAHLRCFDADTAFTMLSAAAAAGNLAEIGVPAALHAEARAALCAGIVSDEAPS